MWRQFQPNPKGITTGDCTVRAVCAVTGLPWETVHSALCSLSRDMADMPSTNRVWWAFLKGIGFRRMELPDRCPDCYTVAEFAAEHPAGKYVLGPFQHAVAVINGDWWDSWDSGRTVPMYYFEYGGDDNGLRPENVLSADVPAADVPANADGADAGTDAGDAAVTAADEIC